MKAVVGLAALLVALLGGVVLGAQRTVPSVEEADLALAPLLVSRDGHTVTIRAAAPSTLRVCVEPKDFGPTKCATVAALRRGERLQ